MTGFPRGVPPQPTADGSERRAVGRVRREGWTTSVVIPTMNRPDALARTLEALSRQTLPPSEIVVVDASTGQQQAQVQTLCDQYAGHGVRYMLATLPGAASQRNVGIDACAGALTLLLDDDFLLPRDALHKLVGVIDDDSEVRIGGVGVLIGNELATPPSRLSKWVYDRLADRPDTSYAGQIIGPALNFYAEPTAADAVVQVQWLNTGCALYRSEILRTHRFDAFFVGYSFMEDVDLSVRIGRSWTLCVHTGIRGHHEQPVRTSSDQFERARLRVINRHYVMRRTLGRTGASYELRFFAYQAFALIGSLRDVVRLRQVTASLRSIGGQIVGLAQVALGAGR